MAPDIPLVLAYAANTIKLGRMSNVTEDKTGNDDGASAEARADAKGDRRSVDTKSSTTKPSTRGVNGSTRPTKRGAETKPKRKTQPLDREKFTNWSFPKNTLEDSIRLAQALEERYAGKPTPPSDLAQAVGRKVKGVQFGDLLRSANLYGLVKGARASPSIEMQPIGSDVVAPDSPEKRRAALGRAFEQVELFKKVVDFYKGKRIPEDEFFTNTLIREFDIVRDRVGTFIEVFKANLTFVQSFGGTPSQSSPPITREAVTTDGEGHDPDPDRRRDFLDTCFVLMPFKHPFNKCYEEVFKPAIKEAGFEPFRADELFNSGTLIEQVWEQIVKAKVLLAEVSEKNANVFYELGLAHSIGKPVVLVSSDLDDVPFDLRHLRVIIYDRFDPFWGDKLKASIREYVSNARKEPDKSVPQPFRGNLHRRRPAVSEASSD